MRLIDAVTQLLGRSLTPEESNGLAQLQQAYGLDDADPIVIVLGMIGANKILMESLPDALQQKSMQMIELHRQTLVEQSKYMSRVLVSTIAEDLQQTNRIYNQRWILSLLFFMGGIVTAAILFAATIYFYPAMMAHING